MNIICVPNFTLTKNVIMNMKLVVITAQQYFIMKYHFYDILNPNSLFPISNTNSWS